MDEVKLVMLLPKFNALGVDVSDRKNSCFLIINLFRPCNIRIYQK